MEKENRVDLDLKIIRKKHELKNIKLKTQYIITKEYHTILNVLKELLNKQKSIDKENFLKNLMSIDEFKNEVLKRKKKKALFNKLNKVEQDFIIQNEYRESSVQNGFFMRFHFIHESNRLILFVD